MAVESITLYKLIILYMLDRVSFPLSNNAITGFILETGYTDLQRSSRFSESFRMMVSSMLKAAGAIRVIRSPTVAVKCLNISAIKYLTKSKRGK